jgi:hypothetical protein
MYIKCQNKFLDYKIIYRQVKDIIYRSTICDPIVLFKQLNQFCYDCIKYDEEVRTLENISVQDLNKLRTCWKHLCFQFLSLQPFVDRSVFIKTGISVLQKFDDICKMLQSNVSQTPLTIECLTHCDLSNLSDLYLKSILEGKEFARFLENNGLMDTPLFVFWNSDTQESDSPLNAWIMRDKLEWNISQLQNLLDLVSAEIKKRQSLKKIFFMKNKN